MPHYSLCSCCKQLVPLSHTFLDGTCPDCGTEDQFDDNPQHVARAILDRMPEAVSQWPHVLAWAAA